MSLEADPDALDAAAAALGPVTKPVGSVAAQLRDTGGQAARAAGDPGLNAVFAQIADNAAARLDRFGAEAETYRARLTTTATIYRNEELLLGRSFTAEPGHD